MTELTTCPMKKNGRYNWKGQPERLVYIGHNWSGNGYWHQFEKVDEPGVVWCEVLDSDLHMIEETQSAAAQAEKSAASRPSGDVEGLTDIDAALAALVDVKPLAAYGEPGTYDTVQARRQCALEKAEQSLLSLRRRLAAPPSIPAKAEQRLSDAGVFKGAHGLRGLAESQEFWDKQPYSTRLYYGDGGADYLHRSVLETAVELLDRAASQPQPDEVICQSCNGTGDAYIPRDGRMAARCDACKGRGVIYD